MNALSSRSGRQDHSSKRERRPSYGGSGRALPTIALIGNGHVVKAQRRRTTFSIGMSLNPSKTTFDTEPVHVNSLGERYGLRLIPGASSFLVLPNNISRSTAVDMILHPERLGTGQSPVTGRMPWTMPDAGEATVGGHEPDFVLGVSGDEELLRRLNEMDGAETCYTKEKGMVDAKWKLDRGEVMSTLWQFANVS